MSYLLQSKIICLILFVISLTVFSQALNIHGLEFRDDEIFYVKSTQEMLANGNYLSPTYFGEDRFQKPILFYWLILLSYKIFGAGWFAARYVSVIFAGLCVCLTWLIAKKLFNHRTALLSSLIVMTVPLFFRHAKDAVPDMALNFFIVLAMYLALIVSSDQQKEGWRRYAAPLFFVSCALGFLVKGFAALIFPFLTVIICALITRSPKLLKDMKFIQGFAIILVIILPWFLYMIKVHGSSYFEYMLVNETRDRLLGMSGTSFFLSKGKSIIEHIGFYTSTIFSYFAPWSLFFFPAVIMAMFRKEPSLAKKQALQFMLIWTFSVFIFFACMYFVINHYMLVLTTPFAILTSYFLLEVWGEKRILTKWINAFRKYAMIFIFTVSVLAFCFLVFFLGVHVGWLIVFAAGYAATTVFLVRSQDVLVPPLVAGLFFVFVFSQSNLLNQAGVTSHSTLQRFAQTVNHRVNQDDVIAVGSHDIHEKEWQVYFDRKVIKAANDGQDGTRDLLGRVFRQNNPVYCLITQEDIKIHFPYLNLGEYDILQYEYIFRKRVRIDKGFFIALLNLNQQTVRDYLMEKLVLVYKHSAS